VLQALEIRAGKTTICSKCSQPLTIPSDRSQWLNERGEPLAASPTLNLGSGTPGRSTSKSEDHDAGDDVLGAIFVGSDVAPTGLPPKALPFAAPRGPQPAPEPPPGSPPRTGRIPFPLPDTPRSAAWLIPPPRTEDARLTAAPPPVTPPADTPKPEPAAR